MRAIWLTLAAWLAASLVTIGLFECLKWGASGLNSSGNRNPPTRLSGNA